MDKECQAPSQALTGLFQKIISDIKSSGPVWEELSKQAIKLQTQLKNTAIVLGMFLDAFQKVADLANNSPGATKEIGAGLTRLCVREKNLESKLKILTGSLSECLVQSLQDSVEEWKKSAVQLDKDHNKEYKKAQQEIKKASSETLRLKKKAKKAAAAAAAGGGGGVKADVGSEMFDALESKYSALEESESAALRSALILQRNQFCQFFHHLSPVLEKEMDMLGEIEHMKEVIDHLTDISANQNTLPLSSEQIVIDLKSSSTAAAATGAAAGTAGATLLMPPSQLGSQVSLSSQHSSHRSSRHSESSGSLQSIQSALQQQQSTQLIGQNPTNFPSRFVSSSLVGISSLEYRQMSSVSSHDSGFVSQEIPTSLSADHSSPLISSTLDPPRSFIHPNLNAIYADSPDRGFTVTATDGGLADAAAAAAAACKRPHTISAAFGNVKARTCVTSDVFPEQHEGLIQGFPSQAEAEALRKRGSMLLQQRQLQEVSQQRPSHPQQYPQQQQQQQQHLQQQKYQPPHYQQQLHNAGIAYSSEQLYREQGYSDCTLKNKNSKIHDGRNSAYEVIPARNSVRYSGNVELQFDLADPSQNRCSCPVSSAETCSRTDSSTPFQNSNHQNHSHLSHHTEHPYKQECLSGSTVAMRQVSQTSGSHYAVPNVTGIRRPVSSDSSDGSATADIYARPSLLIGRRAGGGPVPVATPSIPGEGGDPQRSQRSSTRISEEMEEEVQTKIDSTVSTKPDLSLPQLKTKAPATVSSSTTECINLNGLLENIESIILLNKSETPQTSRSQREPPNDLPPPPFSPPSDLPYPVQSERPLSRHGNLPGMFPLDSGSHDDFPPPPPSMMLTSLANDGRSYEQEHMKVNQTTLSNLAGRGSTVESVVTLGNGDSVKLGREELVSGSSVGESGEEGSLLSAIRNVKLRKTEQN